jgi:hypothetical protein
MILVGAVLACAAHADPPRAPEPAAVTETIEESTVGDLDGSRVPMGNMSQRTYTRADGTSAEGWTCTLALATGAVVVGVGSAVEVDGASWLVTAVEKKPGEPGSVTLRKK